jgi:hypothetical protein
MGKTRVMAPTQASATAPEAGIGWQVAVSAGGWALAASAAARLAPPGVPRSMDITVNTVASASTMINTRRRQGKPPNDSSA